MKLERAHEYLTVFFVTLLGILFAVYAGSLSGKGQIGSLVTLLGLALCVGILLIARQRVWMLIPICWALNGQIPVLPLPFGPRDIVVLLVFGTFLVLKALKVIRLKPTYSSLDFCVVLVLLYLVSVYLRNPVGVSALGSDRVGGRPYFNIFIGAVAYWVLARSILSPLAAKILPLLMLGGSLTTGFLGTLTYYFPSTVPILSQIYTGVTAETYNAGDLRFATTGETTSRKDFLMHIGGPVALALCSYFRPLTLINPLHIWRFVAFMTSLGLILFSGFRSVLLAVMVWMMISSYFRGGTIDMIRLFFLGAPVLVILVAMQGTVIDLPLSAQRTLSFLPGNWNPIAVSDAKSSTEWRTHMWKTVLTEEKYIKNRWLGDGFGFTKYELFTMTQAITTGDGLAMQENMMIVGAVHSGPISAIRYVGIVGFGLFLGLLFVTCREAVRLANRAKGTVYFPVTLMVCIPIIWEPINYIFIFGGFDSALPNALFNAGLIKMLGLALPAPASPEPVRAVDLPAPRRQPAFAGGRPAVTRVPQTPTR